MKNIKCTVKTHHYNITGYVMKSCLSCLCLLYTCTTHNVPGCGKSTATTSQCICHVIPISHIGIEAIFQVLKNMLLDNNVWASDVYMPLLNMSELVPGYSHLNILLFLSFNMHNPLWVKSICLEAHLHFMQRGNTSGQYSIYLCIRFLKLCHFLTC